MDDSWRTPQLRQSVVSKLNDAIQASPGPNRSAIEMENHVFQKAKTKEQYLAFVARLIVHVRDMNPNRQAQGGESQGGNPDPINALQNLANQGSRPPPNAMAGNNPNMGQGNMQQQPQQQQQQQQHPQPNLLQTLTQQRNPQVQQQQQGPAGPIMQQAMGNRGPQQMQQGNMMGGGGQMMNTMVQGPMMGGGVPHQQMNQMGGGGGGGVMMNQQQMGGQGQGMVNMGGMGPGGQQMVMNPGMQQGNVPGGMVGQPGGVPMNQGMVNQMQNAPQGGGGGGGGPMNPNAPANQMNMMTMGMARKPQEMMMNSPGNMFAGTTGVRSVTPNQFLRENPSPSVPSPANMANPQSQMIPSPAMAQSPSPQMMNQRNMSNVMAPSPGTSLNTPGQPGTIPSPMNPQEDQLYKEKYRQLVKYIEPLKRMTAKMMHEKNTKAIHKINTLLEILSNSNQRIPLETLIKCERALEQMNVGTPSGAGSGGASKEGSTSNPLIEAVTANLQSPIRNHTLQRTFKPCLDALFGSDLSDLPSPPKMTRMSQEINPPSGVVAAQQEIPHILQGEIAHLDQKFKINLDASCQTGNKTIRLICCLDDKYLPCIPPVSVTIPEEYPTVSPSCIMSEHEYNATPFLSSVHAAFAARVAKLPRIYSLTHLLDTWEMAVRQACSPKNDQESLIQLGIFNFY